MIPTVLQVALGGALGATARYGVGRALVREGGMPVGVIAVNVIGSFLIGALVVWAARRGAGHLSPFLVTGVLGGFTTFSAFSLEFAELVEQGAWTTAGAYVAFNVIGSLLAVFAGLWVARSLIA